MGKRRGGKLDFDRAAEVLRALGNPARLRIVRLLLDAGEMHGPQLAAALRTSQSLTYHHLRVLQAAGLATKQRAGRRVYYRLSAPLAGDVLRLVLANGD